MEKLQRFFEENKLYVLAGVLVLFGVILISGLFSAPTQEIEDHKEIDYSVKVDSISSGEIGIFPDQKIVDTQNPFDTVQNVTTIAHLKEKTNQLDHLGKETENKPVVQREEKSNKRKTHFDPYADESFWDNNKRSSESHLAIDKTAYSRSERVIDDRNENTVKEDQIEEEEEESDLPEGWINPNYDVYGTGERIPGKRSGRTTTKLIKASIEGTYQKKNRVTKEDPRVIIRVLEDFWIQGIKIPKDKKLIAYARFTNDVSLKITHIKQGSESISCNIAVMDANGQPSIRVEGGAGASIAGDVKEDIGDEIASEENVQKIPGASSVTKGLFRKKPKAYMTPSYVHLKIN